MSLNLNKLGVDINDVVQEDLGQDRRKQLRQLDEASKSRKH